MKIAAAEYSFLKSHRLSPNYHLLSEKSFEFRSQSIEEVDKEAQQTTQEDQEGVLKTLPQPSARPLEHRASQNIKVVQDYLTERSNVDLQQYSPYVRNTYSPVSTAKVLRV